MQEEAADTTLMCWREPEISLAAVLGMDSEVLRSLVEKARALMKIGKTEAAEVLLEDLALVDRSSSLAAYELGALRARRGYHAGAVGAYTESLDRIPKDATPGAREHVLIARAESLLALGRLSSALDDLGVVAESRDGVKAEQARAMITALVAEGGAA
jgi:hypothetical protein